MFSNSDLSLFIVVTKNELYFADLQINPMEQ